MRSPTLLDNLDRSDNPDTDNSQVASPGIPDRNARLIALLDTFDDGDPEQQRRDFAALQAGLDAARPRQRRFFGEGVNP